MDQADFLSLVGSLYDKLVTDVAERVKAQVETTALATDIINQAVDQRIKSWGDHNLQAEIQLWADNRLADEIEAWVEHNLDVSHLVSEAIENDLDLSDIVKEVLRNELTLTVEVS